MKQDRETETWWIRPEADYRMDHILTLEEYDEFAQDYQVDDPPWVQVVPLSLYEAAKARITELEAET